VRSLTDSTGTVTDTYDYDAFGNLIASTGSMTNNYLFAGEQFDPNLGFYYNRARYLDVRSGRFWGMDEVEGNGFEPLSLHKYLYARLNPVNNLDRDGHQVEETTFVASEEQSIGTEEDATDLKIFQQIFRTTLYAGKELLYSTPTLLLRAVAGLTALSIAASSILDIISGPPGELPTLLRRMHSSRVQKRR